MAGAAGLQAGLQARLQQQVAAVMEVFANAAVEEICALLERSFTQLQLENSGLRRKLRMIEIRENLHKRSHKPPRAPDGRGNGRMVRVRIRSVNTQCLSDGVGTQKATENLIPGSGPEVAQPVLQCVEDEDPDVLIIKEERVDSMRSKEPDLQQNLGEPDLQQNLGEPDLQQNLGEPDLQQNLGEPDLQQNLGEEQRNQFRSSEDRDDFLEQNSQQILQQQCERKGRDFLKEENLEQHVAEDKDLQMINGNPQESCSAAEPGNASWDGCRFEAAGHSLAFPDCGAGTSIGEFYIHESTGETLSFGTQGNPDGSAVPPFPPEFAPQGVKERFLCRFCGKSFPNTSALELHQRVHTGEKPYYCSLCGKRFSQSSSLKKHFSIHLGEKPFRCVHCGKSFSDQSNLRKHVNVHTGEKPYGCSQCGKTFNQSSNLKTHMKIHTREKPFGCETCGQIFAYKNSLLKHQQKNCLPHPEEPFYLPDH